MDIRDIPVYIAHYTPAVERKAFMERQLSGVGFFDVTFIETFDREVLTAEDYASYEPSPEKGRERFGEIHATMLENAAFNGSKKTGLKASIMPRRSHSSGLLSRQIYRRPLNI
jgi:hypothetical protein